MLRLATKADLDKTKVTRNYESGGTIYTFYKEGEKSFLDKGDSRLKGNYPIVEIMHDNEFNKLPLRQRLDHTTVAIYMEHLEEDFTEYFVEKYQKAGSNFEDIVDYCKNIELQKKEEDRDFKKAEIKAINAKTLLINYGFYSIAIVKNIQLTFITQMISYGDIESEILQLIENYLRDHKGCNYNPYKTKEGKTSELLNTQVLENKAQAKQIAEQAKQIAELTATVKLLVDNAKQNVANNNTPSSEEEPIEEAIVREGAK